MRAALFREPRTIEVGDRPDAAISEPTDAVVRVVLACVCGSDLWYYRGDRRSSPARSATSSSASSRTSAPRSATSPRATSSIAPFAFSDGTCPHCRHGITTRLRRTAASSRLNGDGGQGEAVRVPLADGTLVPVPGSGHSDEMHRARC